MVGAFQSQTHVKTREDVLEQMTWRSEGTVSTGSQLRERGCKSCPVQSCWGKGISPVSTFLQPGAVLQHCPRKEANQGQGQGSRPRRSLQQLDVDAGDCKRETHSFAGVCSILMPNLLTGLVTGASTAASCTHRHLPALWLLLWAMMAHLCSLPCLTTLLVPHLALPSHRQCMALSLSALGLSPFGEQRARVAVVTALPAMSQGSVYSRQGTS